MHGLRSSLDNLLLYLIVNFTLVDVPIDIRSVRDPNLMEQVGVPNKFLITQDTFPFLNELIVVAGTTNFIQNRVSPLVADSLHERS